jgi:hypothetical protein
VDYPEDFTTTDRWLEAIDTITGDERLFGYFKDCLRRPLQSNVEARYVGLVATMGLLQWAGRLTTCRGIDIGCSLGNGIKLIQSGIPFDVPQVLSYDDRADGWRPDDRQTQGFGALVNGTSAANTDSRVGPQFTAVTCVDVSDPFPRPDDPWSWWAYDSSFNPSELLNPYRVSRVHSLLNSGFDTIGYTYGDITDDPAFVHELRLKDADIVSAVTVAYELDDAGRGSLLANMIGIGRFAVNQDFAEVSREAPAFLDYRGRWVDHENKITFPYRTILLDAEAARRRIQAAREFQEVLLWDGGRVEKVALGDGQIMTGEASRYDGKTVPFRQLMHDFTDNALAGTG